MFKYDENIEFLESGFNEIKNEYIEYVKNLPYSCDSYLRHMHLNSSVFKIMKNKENIGFFMYKDNVLSLVKIKDSVMHLDRLIMSKILEHFNVFYAYVLSFDYKTLRLFLDVSKQIENKAYVFIHDKSINNKISLSKEYKTMPYKDDDSMYVDSLGLINKKNELTAKDRMFISKMQSNKRVGLGICLSVPISENYMDIGIIVNKELRNHKIGNNLLFNITEEIYKLSKKPCAECNVNNEEARRILENNNYRPVGTIYKITFDKQKYNR